MLTPEDGTKCFNACMLFRTEMQSNCTYFELNRIIKQNNLNIERTRFKVLNIRQIIKVMIYKNILRLLEKVVSNIIVKQSLTNILQVSDILYALSVLNLSFIITLHLIFYLIESAISMRMPI